MQRPRLPNECFVAQRVSELKQFLERYQQWYAAAGILPISVAPSDRSTAVALLGLEVRRKESCWNDFGGKVETSDRAQGGILATALREFREETCGAIPTDRLEEEDKAQDQQHYLLPQPCVWGESGRYLLFPRRIDYVDVTHLQNAKQEIVQSGSAQQILDANKTEFRWVPLPQLADAIAHGSPVLSPDITLARFFFSNLRIKGAMARILDYGNNVLQLPS